MIIAIRTYTRWWMPHRITILLFTLFRYNHLRLQYLSKYLFNSLLLPVMNRFECSQLPQLIYQENHQVCYPCLHLRLTRWSLIQNSVFKFLNRFSGNFEHDLCDCCSDIVSCCCSCCCPCIVACQIANKINGNDCCGCCGCCACLGVCFLGGFAVACLRCDFRKTRKIQGGCCADCITSICCTTCALTQMHREAQKIWYACKIKTDLLTFVLSG